MVGPADSIQAALDRYGLGATICILGEHRLTSALLPKSGQTLIGEGAILNGTKLVTNWARSGSLWMASGQTQSFPDPIPNGSPCELNPMACQFEDLFRDDRPMTRVSSKDQVGPGKWYFDEAYDQLFTADDPTGHKMEASAGAVGIAGNGADNVTIEGLIIEKFAYHGIAWARAGWIITRNEIAWNHSHGIRLAGTDIISSHNYVHHNGNMGITGTGSRLLFEENHLAFNNYLRFGRIMGWWHAGAIKIYKSSDVVVRDNYSHDNLGDGWWIDWDNIRITIEGNLFERNSRDGLFYEASFDAMIRSNLFRDNGWGNNAPDRYGSEVFINTSKNVELYGNTFEGNRDALGAVSTDRGTSQLYGLRETANLSVHDNSFVLMRERYAITVPFSKSRFPKSSRFTRNAYQVPDASGKFWDWLSGPVGWTSWRAYGFDAAGNLIQI